MVFALALLVGCAGHAPQDAQGPQGPDAWRAHAPAPEKASVTVSEIGVPYGAYVRCSHPSLPAPLQGYFHGYRDGHIVLNAGRVPFDSSTRVEPAATESERLDVAKRCDTLARDAQWSLVKEGLWATLYGESGRRLAKGRVDFVLPDTLFIGLERVARDSVCRIEVAWRNTGETSLGLMAVPVIVGKTLVKVTVMLPVALYSLVTGDKQTLYRFVEW